MPECQRCATCRRPKRIDGPHCYACRRLLKGDSPQAQWEADGPGRTEYAAAPCPHRPGSDGKLLAMVARARARRPLFLAGDDLTPSAR